MEETNIGKTIVDNRKIISKVAIISFLGLIIFFIFLFFWMDNEIVYGCNP
jgi:hypothetical protein